MGVGGVGDAGIAALEAATDLDAAACEIACRLYVRRQQIHVGNR